METFTESSAWPIFLVLIQGRKQGIMVKEGAGKVELETNREAKTSVFPRGSQARSPKELPMEGKLEVQKLRETAFTRDRKFRLPLVDESKRSASQQTKYSLAFCTVADPLFLAYTKR